MSLTCRLPSAGWALLVVAAIVSSWPAIASQRGPRLLIEGPEASGPTAAGIRAIDPGRFLALMELVGLERAGAPIHLLLAPENSPAAREVPEWVAGYADSSADLIVLFPSRSPSYPHSGFEGLVVHEVAHVLIDRAADGRSVPRWFHEGLATASGEWGFADRTRVVVALLLGDDRSLADLDEAFASADADRVARAYALSAAFVRDLLAREGSGAAARILRARASGSSFPDAFEEATGVPLARAEAVFWDGDARWMRWIEVLANSAVVWTAIVLLAAWAYFRSRARAARIRRRWEREEERMADQGPEAGPSDPVR